MTQPVWLDESVFAINREQPRALLPRYDTLADLAADRRSDRLDLDGDWRFQWVDGLVGFDEERAGRVGPAGNDTIPVPGLWQLYGYGIPYYLANRFPPAVGTKDFPNIKPEDNEAGIYARDFEVPADWDGRSISVVFEAVKAGLSLYCNGTYVGYTQGSFEVAEFELTPYLQAGQNTLTAVVYRYTDGTYLEDQDMWFLSGIFRSVWLSSTPTVAIADVWVRPDLDTNYVDGRLDVEVEVANRSESAVTAEVEVFLTDPDSSERRSVGTVPVDALATRGSTGTVTVEVPNAVKWTAETPHLYTVTVVLRVNGAEVHATTLRTGIRKVEIKDAQVLVNGTRIMFKGVNRHDFDPDHAWAVPTWRYREDLLELKRLNMNAVRCSHYPNPQIFYDLCDELGLYVMDECDLETHGIRRKNIPGDDPRWTAPAVDRMVRMVVADRNHPSVVFWSLGNEAGLGGEDGGNFVAMREATLAFDDTRPFHYEGDHQIGVSDVVSRMYATAEQMATLGRQEPLTFGPLTKIKNMMFTDDKNIDPAMQNNRPVMLCEYAHAMENSVGNLEEYLEVFYRYPNMLGGFIWDCIDQSIRRKGPNGEDHWLYGGDFGDKPTHGCFALNGLFAADRARHPSTQEVTWAYRNIVVRAVDVRAGRFTVTNRFSFTNVDQFEPVLDVLLDGVVARTTRLNPVAVAPWETVSWEVPEAVVEAGETGEVIVRFRWLSREDEPWAEAGSEVAFDEFSYQRRGVQPEVAKPSPVVAIVTRTKDEFRAEVGDHRLVVDASTGAVEQWSVNGHEVLAGSLRPNYWRALIDNDRGLSNAVPSLAPILVDTTWRSPRIRVAKVQDVRDDNGWQVTFALRSPVFTAAVLQYRIDGAGRLSIMHRVIPRKAMVRLGMTTQLAAVDRVRWYGKGPLENYIDRLRGARTQVWDLPLDQMRHLYVRPQENGNRSQVRWVEFVGPNGVLRADDATGDLLGFTAWPFTQEALDAADHIHELEWSDTVTVNIDRLQRGVGGDLPGEARLLPQYSMPAGQQQSLQMTLTFQPR